ncbi:MAG TPA: cation:proton antiporter [Pseudomonadales bacterium]|nr:cation:proton antiporter [Pseudomonadales bacterium]
MAPEAAAQGVGLFPDLLLIFATALVTVAACRPLRLPGTLGYFVAGALLGPTGFGLIVAGDQMQLLAEFGVVLLLFSLGLEFSLPRLLAMRRSVFGVGVLQVAVTGGVFTAALGFAGIDWGLAVLLGGGLALSSTALVTRELSLTGQLHEPHGRQALGVLLFQDLFAVFLLILVPVLGAGADASIADALLGLGLRGLLLFVVLMGIGRYVLPHLFGEIARSRSSELFVLAALVVVMGAAWLTHAFGLSMALGGFVGGMMLGESHFRHQVQADIRPFRDVLLGLFLVTVGMMLDLELLREYWPRVLAFGVILMIVKGLLLVAVVRAFGDSLRVSLRTAIVLAQGGEFAFAMLALAAGAGLVEPDVQAFMVAVTLVSMVLTPLLVRRNGAIAERILRSIGTDAPTAPATAAQSADAPSPSPSWAEAPEVLLLGYGRVGQAIGRLLERCGVSWLALDADPDRVAEAVLTGAPVRFGDARRGALLHASGIGEVRLVVLCIDDPEGALEALGEVRVEAPKVPVLVRTRDETQFEALLAAGATEVVPETFESSLMLLSHAIALLGRPRAEADAVLAGVRAERYSLLHGVIGGDLGDGAREVVHPVLLTERASALGRAGEALSDMLDGVEVRGVRRRNRTLSLDEAGALQAGDILILLGAPALVEAAEARLLVGSRTAG